MSGKGILPNFLNKLRGTTDVCVFVSTHAADQIEELAYRARGAASFEEFQQEFLNAEKLSKTFLDLICRWENCSRQEAYEFLQRIRVQTISEDFLASTIDYKLKTLVEGKPSNVSAELFKFALDSIHKELTAVEIWRYLESQGFKRLEWAKDPHVLASVEAANKRYLKPIADAAIANRIIPRPEVDEMINLLTSADDSKSVLVVGEAGAGKSGVIYQAASKLMEQGIPVLAFRVDRLEPKLLPENVGSDLGLPGSPAGVLAAVAKKRNCVLIVDQIDAVSLASGRNPQFFDCINEIIEQALMDPSIRLVLSCRKFDLENDQRLRRLQQNRNISTVAVDRLSDEVVKTVVSDVGLDSSKLSTHQLKLLSLPLHLSLFTEIATDLNADVLSFQTVNDLYDRFWNYKQNIIKERLGRPVKWVEVIDILADYMSEKQILSVPENKLDAFRDDAMSMASEHVLTRDETRYAFFHEGFFDYAFARRFAARGFSLLPLLLKNEQRLFRRAQVRQILAHSRADDFTCYLGELQHLLTSSEIRFHIKQVVLALLGNISDPTYEEWNLLAPLLNDKVLSRNVLRLLHGSVPWITRLDSCGVLSKWLYEADEEKIDQAVWLLNSVQKNFSERIVALVEPFLNASERWNSRLNMIMAWGELFASRRFFDLFLRLMDEGVLDNLRGPIAVNSDFWSLLYSLPEKNAECCCEIISHYLNRRLAISLLAGEANPFSVAIPDSQFDSRILLDSAQRSPYAFIHGILPFMLTVIKSNINKENGIPQMDKVWWYRSVGDSYSVSGNLLDAMEAALRSLAEKDVPAFTIIIEQLEPLEFETIQYLLIRAYSANGKEFADRAADYLCEKPYRLQTGYSSNSHWATRQLLEAITPFCSKEKLEKLESLILDYYSEWEKDAKGLYSRGNAQFTLLEGFAPDRRSARLTKRLDEWRRKFQKEKPEEPRPSKVFTVASPIPETALDKMTDEQWLRAIAKYDHEEMRTRSFDKVTGGSFQLSQVLENATKKEARRFIELALIFPDNAHPDYFNAILRGIMGADLDIEEVLPVCIKCHNLPGKPCGRWIHRPIAALAEKALPQEALEMVAWYATEDPDPEKEMWRTEASSGNFYYGGRILDAAINSVRGSACESIAKLIFANSNYITFFLPSIKKMVNDPSVAVRSCVAEVLTAVLSHDRQLAVSLFSELCQTEDILLGTRYVERFLYFAINTHFAVFKPMLELMIVSETPKVQTVGARQICLASLENEEARPNAMKCLEGTENLRIGAAQIFSANLRNAHFRIFCEESLLKLLNDESEKVQSEAAGCFDDFEGEQLLEYAGFLDKYLQSSSFKKGYYRLFLALEKSTADLLEITCRACERFVDSFGTEASDIRTGVAADAMKVSKLIVRVYSQATDKLLQKRCLDVIDKMMLVGMYGLDEAISSFDR